MKNEELAYKLIKKAKKKKLKKLKKLNNSLIKSKKEKNYYIDAQTFMNMHLPNTFDENMSEYMDEQNYNDNERQFFMRCCEMAIINYGMLANLKTAINEGEDEGED